MLKGPELKRDIETIPVGTNQAKIAGDTSTPRKTAWILSWIASNTSKGTAGSPADPLPADGTDIRDDGTPIAFTEARLKSVLFSVWINGGKPGTIMTGAFNKLLVWDKVLGLGMSYTFKAMITVIVTGLVGAVWLGIKVMLGR